MFLKYPIICSHVYCYSNISLHPPREGERKERRRGEHGRKGRRKEGEVGGPPPCATCPVGGRAPYPLGELPGVVPVERPRLCKTTHSPLALGEWVAVP